MNTPSVDKPKQPDIYEDMLQSGLKKVSPKIRSFSNYPDLFFTQLIKELSMDIKANVLINLIEMVASNEGYPTPNTESERIDESIAMRIKDVFQQFCIVAYEKRVGYVSSIDTNSTYKHEAEKLKRMVIELKRAALSKGIDLVAFLKAHNGFKQRRQEGTRIHGQLESKLES